MSRNTKNIIITFGIGCLVFLIGNAIFSDFKFENLNGFLLNLTFYQLRAFRCADSNLDFCDYFEKYPWKDKDSVRRIAIGISGSIVLTLVVLFLLRVLTAMFYSDQSFEAVMT